MLKRENGQQDFHSELLEKLVRKDHPYRKIKEIVNFKELLKPFHELYSCKGAEGIAVEIGFKCLLTQFFDDLSDRQMENALKDNFPVKWFCGFSLTEPTPDHSYFGKLRKRIGTERLVGLFNQITERLKAKNLISSTFSFVDATMIVSKVALWEERDKAIKNGLDKLNNDNVGNYSADKDARFGCKGKNKFWFGYKKHCAVDMKHGLISAVAVTPANVPDARAIERICPEGGMVFGDKGYSTKAVEAVLAERGCHSGIIRKNNDPKKNKEKDRWLTKVRMPFESVFAATPKRTRYKGIAKTQFQATLEAIAFNLRRLVRISSPPLSPTGA